MHLPRMTTQRRMLLAAVIAALATLAVASRLGWRITAHRPAAPGGADGSAAGNSGPGEHERLARLFGGADGLAVIRHPDRVVAVRLDPLSAPLGSDPMRYPVLAGPIPVPAGPAAAVAAALSSPNAYGWDYAKGCLPTYGVRLAFYRGRVRVDVLLCLNCDILAVVRDGMLVGGEDFDPIRATLVGVIQDLFPNDPAIRSLSKEGGGYVKGV